MPVSWDEDPPGSEAQILRNATAVLRSIVAAADQRDPPTIDMARGWHRALYDGIALPVAYYAGEVRDSDSSFPQLYGYEVSVGPLSPGAPSATVPSELANFERQARIAVDRIDAAIAVGARPATPRQLRGVLFCCAVMHGEWVRIHPFANGNGRTARLWANWVALRYGLPPFVAVRPRPADTGYPSAAAESMRGDHTVALAVFSQLLRDALSAGRA